MFPPMSRALLPTTAAALALALVCSCQSESSRPADTYIAPQVAGVEPTPVFEGLQKIALHFSGTDFSGVTAPPTFSVTSGNEPRPGDIEITDWLCNNVRCGVALRLGKWLPGHGQALPSPIQGQQVRILFEGAANQISATLLVMPLDHGGGSSTSSPPHMTGTWMFYDFRLGVDVPLSVEPDATGLPGRILVTNEISLASGATIVASGLPGIAVPPAGGAAGPGGFPGAASGDDAALPMGGRAGSAPGAGGGGGGFGEAGSPGEGVDPAIGGEGGSAGQGVELDCLRANTAGCGGGGGGSAGSGEGGGGGGGGVLIVSLGTMDMAGNAIRSDGGDGAEGVTDSGGGGGAGGAIGLGAVRASRATFAAALGGAGSAGAAGGAEAGWRVRDDSSRICRSSPMPRRCGTGPRSTWKRSTSSRRTRRPR